MLVKIKNLIIRKEDIISIQFNKTKSEAIIHYYNYYKKQNFLTSYYSIIQYIESSPSHEKVSVIILKYDDEVKNDIAKILNS